MAASNAITGYNTIVDVEATVGELDYFTLGEVTSVTLNSDTVDDIEVTHMQSPGRRKEFLAGLIDGNTATFKLNNIPGDATDDFCAAWQTAGERRSTRVTLPNGKTRTFTSYVKSFVPDAIEPGKAITATMTVKVAGAVTRG